MARHRTYEEVVDVCFTFPSPVFLQTLSLLGGTNMERYLARNHINQVVTFSMATERRCVGAFI
jgi:hypothetical protein